MFKALLDRARSGNDPSVILLRDGTEYAGNRLLRTRVKRFPLESSEADWRADAERYWARQAERFGVRVDPLIMRVTTDDNSVAGPLPLIVTCIGAEL